MTHWKAHTRWVQADQHMACICLGQPGRPCFQEHKEALEKFAPGAWTSAYVIPEPMFTLLLRSLINCAVGTSYVSRELVLTVCFARKLWLTDLQYRLSKSSLVCLGIYVFLIGFSIIKNVNNAGMIWTALKLVLASLFTKNTLATIGQPILWRRL